MVRLRPFPAKGSGAWTAREASQAAGHRQLMSGWIWGSPICRKKPEHPAQSTSFFWPLLLCSLSTFGSFKHNCHLLCLSNPSFLSKRNSTTCCRRLNVVRCWILSSPLCATILPLMALNSLLCWGAVKQLLTHPSMCQVVGYRKTPLMTPSWDEIICTKPSWKSHVCVYFSFIWFMLLCVASLPRPYTVHISYAYGMI